MTNFCKIVIITPLDLLDQQIANGGIYEEHVHKMDSTD